MIKRQKHLKAQFLRKVKVKMTKEDIKNKTPDILPKNNSRVSKKHIW